MSEYNPLSIPIKYISEHVLCCRSDTTSPHPDIRCTYLHAVQRHQHGNRLRKQDRPQSRGRPRNASGDAPPVAKVRVQGQRVGRLVEAAAGAVQHGEGQCVRAERVGGRGAEHADGAEERTEAGDLAVGEVAEEGTVEEACQTGIGQCEWD